MKKLYWVIIISVIVTISGLLYVHKVEKTVLDNRLEESNNSLTVLQKEKNNIEELEKETIEKQNIEVVEPKFVRVYICGAVKHPDVYEVDEICCINDVLQKAGGANEEADLNKINLALSVQDEMQIYIPKKGESIEIDSVEKNDIGINSKININTADKNTLTKLYRIGEVTASRIIDYRNKHGNFQSIEDIKKVKGIGEKIFEENKDKITVK